MGELGDHLFRVEKMAPQTPQKRRQGERVSTLSPPGPPLSTTKEGGLRSPLFGNSPELFWRKVIYPSGLLRYAAGVRGVFPLTSRVPAPAYLWGGAYIVYRTVFPQLHAVENLLATIKQTEWKGGDFI